MTNDGLKPTHQEEIKEEDNNDENLGEPANPETPDSSRHIDSSRYHYQPSNDSPETAPKKSEASLHSNSKSLMKGTAKITDITSAFVERFSL
jgi:hypothetical protein